MNNLTRNNFGSFQHIPRTAAVVAKQKVKKIYTDDINEAERLRKERDQLSVNSTWKSDSDSDSGSVFEPSRAQQRVAWPGVKRTTVTQFGPNMAGAKPKTPVDKNKNMDSSSDGSPATPRKRGRPPLTGNVKVKKEESADSKANIFLDFPQNVKVGVQLMLLTKHCDGLNEALVEKEFHTMFPSLSDFNACEYGFRSFESMLGSLAMKTHVYTNKIKSQPTWFGHSLATYQAKVGWDLENNMFYMAPIGGTVSAPPTSQSSLEKLEDKNKGEEASEEQQKTPMAPPISQNRSQPEDLPKVVAPGQGNTSTVSATAAKNTANPTATPTALAINLNMTNMSGDSTNTTRVFPVKRTLDGTQIPATSIRTVLPNSEPRIVPCSSMNTRYETVDRYLEQDPRLQKSRTQLVTQTAGNIANSRWDGPIITNVSGGDGKVIQVVASPSAAAKMQNLLPNLFYRRNELPPDWTQHNLSISQQSREESNNNLPKDQEENSLQVCGERPQRSGEGSLHRDQTHVSCGGERFKPKNSHAQNMAFSLSVLRHARVMAAMRKINISSTTEHGWIPRV